MKPPKHTKWTLLTVLVGTCNYICTYKVSLPKTDIFGKLLPTWGKTAFFKCVSSFCVCLCMCDSIKQDDETSQIFFFSSKSTQFVAGWWNVSDNCRQSYPEPISFVKLSRLPTFFFSFNLFGIFFFLAHTSTHFSQLLFYYITFTAVLKLIFSIVLGVCLCVGVCVCECS